VRLGNGIVVVVVVTGNVVVVVVVGIVVVVVVIGPEHSSRSGIRNRIKSNEVALNF
jgi:hypothetical protein